MSSALRTIAYDDFRGGLNTDSSPSLLDDKELQEALNVDLDERGALASRMGTIPLNAMAYTGEVTKLIEWPRADGTVVMLGVIGINLVKFDNSWVPTTLQALASADIGWFIHADKFYFTDSTEYRVYDGTTVAAVTANTDASNDLAPIKKCKLFVRNPTNYRIYGTMNPDFPDVVFPSEPDNPTWFKTKTSGGLRLRPSTGDGAIQGMALFGDAVAVIFKTSIWIAKGSDPATDLKWFKVQSTYGTPAPASVISVPGTVGFWGSGGLYTLSSLLLDMTGAVAQPNEELVNNKAKNKVTNLIRNAVHPSTACSIYDFVNSKWLIAYGDDSANLKNNKILVYDWDIGSFTIYDGLQVNCFIQRLNGDLIIGSNGYVLKMGVGHKDWDVVAKAYKPIHFWVKTKSYSLGEKGKYNIKKLKKFIFSVRQRADGASHVDVKIQSDYQVFHLTNIDIDQINLSESFVWGRAWGLPWGYSDQVNKELKVRGKGLTVTIEYENNIADDAITLYGHAFLFRQRPKPQGVKVV